MASFLVIRCSRRDALIADGPVALVSERTSHDIRPGPLRTRRILADFCPTCEREF